MEKCTIRNKCTCKKDKHNCKRIALTGGPGAGKTAVLEIIRKNFCEHITILPEAASIIFSGGFWRKETLASKKAAQRAIFHVQRELEQLVEDEEDSAIALCDRGTVDGLAYWPCEEELFWKEVEKVKKQELKRYAAVIHLRTPSLIKGYNHSNPLRIESAKQAAKIDELIAKAWEEHEKRFFVDSTDDFLEKVYTAINIIRNELPDCCKDHKIENL